MRTWRKLSFTIAALGLGLALTWAADKPVTIKIAMIAKSSTNPVFLSARTGAEAAAKDLSQKHGINVVIDWRTPPTEDGQVQAQRVAQAVNEGADAILISCSDASKVTGAINDAVTRGVAVMTFDSDAAASKRFAFYGTDDASAGEQVMSELAQQLGGKGKVAILAGNQNAPNLRKRAEGVKKEAEKHPGIQIIGTFYHAETPQDAAAEVLRVMNAYPDVTGWAMIGGWPLFTKTLLTDLDPAKVKVVAVDALPAELPYVAKGIAPVLLAQPTYKWGYVSVETIVDKLHLKKDVPVINRMVLVRVTKDNLGTWARQLKDWGFTDVPEEYLKLPQRMPQEPIIRVRDLTKRFPGVVALRDVSLDVARGSCHALCGENGAGKSTLGRVIAGIHGFDTGTIELEGKPVRFANPSDALAAGIGMVHQELAFCENLSVAENLCLGRLPRRGPFVSRRDMIATAGRQLAAIHATIDPRRPVGELTVGQQQLVQIAAAVARGAKVLIFDEPTSSLSQVECEHLFELIKRLQGQGTTSIYVSHRMEEIFRLCDTVTVLRDGQHVATKPVGEMDKDKLVQLMIGRPLAAYFPVHLKGEPCGALLQVENLSSPGKFEGISFTLRAGEVLGMAGLIGSGRTEVAEALFGLDPAARGAVYVNGQRASIRHPTAAMRLRVGMVPEDRKRHGLVLMMAAERNISLPVLDRLATAGWVRRAQERRLADKYFGALRVRASSVSAVAATLSGGNQQKLVLAKWLAAECRVLLIDEPTRGVDVGAKAEIHGLIDQLANEGNAILLISSELPELINLSTRILVLRHGRIAGEVSREQADQQTLMRMMAGL